MPSRPLGASSHCARLHTPHRAARLALTAGLLLLLVAPSVHPASADENDDEATSLWLAGMTFVASRGVHTEIVLEAERARLHPAQNVADLEGVRAVVMGEDGRPGLRLSCQRGEFDLETQDFVASRDVRGRTADGRRFASAWIRYDHARNLAYTDAPVVIHEGERTLRGGGLRYQVREGTLRLLGGASVEQAP